MSKLRNRIESLSSSTSSLKAVELCKEALNTMSEYTSKFRLTPAVLEQVETTVAQALVEGLTLATDKDDKVNDFIKSETRIIGVNNLGVKEALAAVRTTELASHPSLRYVAEGLSRLEGIPEFLTAQTVVEKLSYFTFDPTIAEHVKKIQENITKYAEDIRISTAVKELNEKSSSFLYSSFEKPLTEYLNNRTQVNRAKVLEALNKFNHDAFVRNLSNVIAETSATFNIATTSDSCVLENNYSPVIVSENVEIFNVHGKFYSKKGSEIAPLTENEVTALSADFVSLSNYLNQPNVKITESSITVYAKDKKVTILESEGVPTVKMNDKAISFEDFTKVYLNAGVFRRDEIAEMNNVNTIIENWNNIMDLDFVKTLRSKITPAQYVDVFKIDETLHINKVNPAMNENTFYPSVTATQSRSMVLEFMNYDLGVTFKSILPKEELKLSELSEKKKEYLSAITSLEEKKSLLENHTDARVKDSAEVKELVEAISEEIKNLKDEYFDIQSEINAITTVEEGIGFAVGDEAEVAKKK